MAKKKDKKQWVVPPNLSLTPEFRAKLGAEATLTPELKKALEDLAKHTQRAPARQEDWKCDNIALCDEVHIRCSEGVFVTLCEALLHCDGIVTYGDPDPTCPGLA